MADQWYVSRSGKKHGPFTAAKLKELASQGRLLPTDLLLKEGMQKWVPASSVKGLFTGTTTTARPATVKKASEPDDGEFQFNDADEPDDRHDTPRRQRALAGNGLVILGAAGGGVLLLTLLVVAVVVVFRGRGEDRGSAKDAQVVDGGGSGRRNEEEAGSKDGSSRVTRTAPSHISVLEKPDRRVKNIVGGMCAFTPNGKALIVRLKDGNEFVPKSKLALIDAETEQVRSANFPLARYLFNLFDHNQLQALLLPAEKQVTLREAIETAMRIREKNNTRAKGIILGFGRACEYAAIRGNFRNGQDTSVEVWHLTSNRKIDRESPPRVGDEQAVKLVFSPDNRLLAQAAQKKVYVWDLPSGKLRKTLDFGVGRHLKFSPDGKWLLTQQWRDEAKRNKTDQLVLWNTQDWSKKHAIKPPGQKWDYNLGALCTFSPDGKLLATTNDESGKIRLVTIWDVQTGELRKGFEALEFADLAFAPDGKLLATWGGRSGINIWDLQAGQLKYRIPINARLLSFSPDARVVTVAGGLLYDLSKGKQVAYTDEVQKERDRLASATDLTKPAPPITKAKYDQIKVGMTREQVMRILGGKWSKTVRSDTFKKREGKFGYSVIGRDTVRYDGRAGYALFTFQGSISVANTRTPLVSKQKFGLK